MTFDLIPLRNQPAPTYEELFSRRDAELLIHDFDAGDGIQGRWITGDTSPYLPEGTLTFPNSCWMWVWSAATQVSPVAQCFAEAGHVNSGRVIPVEATKFIHFELWLASENGYLDIVDNAVAKNSEYQPGELTTDVMRLAEFFGDSGGVAIW